MIDKETKRGQVLGFDYVTGQSIRLTPAEWRVKYPPAAFRRAVLDGETIYRRPMRVSKGERIEQRIVAEAYAIIPAGRAST